MVLTGGSEALLFWRYIASSLDRLVACLDGLDADALNWSPPAPGANSLWVLATHTLGNAEENILETLCGESIGRDRASEFAARCADPQAVAARWQILRPRLATALAVLPDGALDAPRPHPRRGTVAGREIMIVVSRHAAEHLGRRS